MSSLIQTASISIASRVPYLQHATRCRASSTQQRTILVRDEAARCSSTHPPAHHSSSPSTGLTPTPHPPIPHSNPMLYRPKPSTARRYPPPNLSSPAPSLRGRLREPEGASGTCQGRHLIRILSVSLSFHIRIFSWSCASRRERRAPAKAGTLREFEFR